MTKLIILTFLLLYSTYMWAAANDIVFTQRNATDTGTFTRFPMVPSATQGVLGFNISTVLPEWWTLGPGLQVTGTTIDVVAGGGQVNSDWSSVSGPSQILNKPTQVSAFTNDSGYITSSALSPYLTTALAGSTYATQVSVTSGLSAKFNNPAGTTSQYVRGDGSLATLPAQTTFTFSQPSSRSLSVSTSYQATDNTKAAVIYPSYACQNATQVLASSACTLQVRVGTGTLTCSTGTPYYTQSLTVGLGLLLTQNSTNPVPIFLPVGASFIMCPTAGTFTINAVEQSAG